MPSTLHFLALLGCAATAAAQQCGPGGSLNAAKSCCECTEGYRGDLCQECDNGYVLNPKDKTCGAGRAGTACIDGGEFPFHGCAVGGQQIGTCTRNAGRSEFPCVCDGPCTQLQTEKKRMQAQCFPAGARMVTSYPNEPQEGRPFDLTVVGCQLLDSDEYLVIDAGKEGGCAAQSAKLEDKPEGACKRTEVGDGAGVFAPAASCFEGRGVLMQYLLQGDAADAQRQKMSERTAKNVQLPSGEYRVCALKGSIDSGFVWAEVASHNSESRDGTFIVCGDATCGTGNRNVAGAAGGVGGECECENGGFIFEVCVPTWLVILLFLMLCIGLVAAGMLLRKAEEKRHDKKWE
eukprot:TRINITY_DN3956_c0_g2_i4.p2 TRINITY_DN3956_c0_g2~~TRINITY_DN3956_c0_g2_i4.p2  ORF type:complete len:348 (+),score=130.57 TRINITY_DN3956_c0_g2_i4:97-1140(+)